MTNPLHRKYWSCPSCSQRYLQVTTETVDWKDGEDPIFRTIIPIDDEERASRRVMPGVSH
ncbi:MAG TPA: hypothetical protein VFT44_04910 [Pyrinomonadaceae bacterium]|nr:hypothetical protein [Pyrinomonadaceae bacterium]